jgi:aspartate aminotransferase
MLKMQPQDRRNNSAPAVSLVDIFLKARELERKGKDVIHFDAGEPDFEPPNRVVEATVRALREGKGRYTEAAGIPKAKKAISDHLENQTGARISPDRILITSGGRLALYYSFASLPKTSRIGIISPDWPAYRELAEFLGYPVRFFSTKLDDGWNVNLDEIRRSDCTTLVLNYPNNPTGKVLSTSTFEQLVQLAIEKKLNIISDEVYSDYTFNDREFKSVLGTAGLRYVFVTSLSKSFSMTGYRAAYVVSDEKTVSRMSKLNSLIMTSAPEFVQYAIIAAMSCDGYVKRKAKMIKKRRDIAVRCLRKDLEAELYIPDGSLYIFPRFRVSKGSFDSEKFALELLDKKFVSVSPGTTFGRPYKQHIRMTLLQNEDRIEEGIERMAKLVA